MKDNDTYLALGLFAPDPPILPFSELPPLFTLCGLRLSASTHLSHSHPTPLVHFSRVVLPFPLVHSLLAKSLDEAVRVTGSATYAGRSGHAAKRARTDGSSWTVMQIGTGVPDAILAVIASRIDALKAASARGGLSPTVLEELVGCLIKGARLGIEPEYTARLLWCLRPRQAMLQSTMSQLLAAMNSSSFSTSLRTQALRWVLLLVLDGEPGDTNGGVGTAGRDMLGAGGVAATGDAAGSSLSHMCINLLRPLYRVLFHMLIAVCSPTSHSSSAATQAAALPSSSHGAAAKSPLSAERNLLCEILITITSRREARPCWLQISLVLAHA